MKTLLTVVAALALSVPAAGAADYIDTHMHLQTSAGGGGQRGASVRGGEGEDRDGPPLGRRGGMGPGRGPRGRGPRGGMRGPRRGPGPGGETYESSAEELISRMDKMGVKKALIVTVPHGGHYNPNFDYDGLFRDVEKYQDRLGVMAGGATLGPIIQNTDPGNVPKEVEASFKKEALGLLKKGAVGFGEMISYHLCMSQRHNFQMVAADHPLFLLLADIAAEKNVPIDLHMEAIPKAMKTPKNLLSACGKNPPKLVDTIAPLERLLAHNRNARIVWQHVGWDNVGMMTPELLGGLLKKHPNLYLAIRVEERLAVVGGDAPMPNRIVDADANITPGWLALFEEFPDRVMVGGDEFITPPEGGRQFPKSFDATWRVLERLPESLRAKIGNANAARVYGL